MQCAGLDRLRRTTVMPVVGRSIRGPQAQRQLACARKARNHCVHAERCHRCSARRCQSIDGPIGVQAEVLRPPLVQGVKKTYGFAAFWVCRSDLVGLVKAAIGTLKCQICQRCRSTFASRYDVIDMKSCAMPELCQSAIAASPGITREYGVS